MAFPTIPTVAAGRVLSALATSPSGTHTSPSLSSLTKNSGDLLLAIVIIYDGNSTNAEFSGWGGGFTEFVDQATTATMGIGAAYKWSTGSETGTFTVTSADTSTNDSAFFLLSIPLANLTTPPEGGTIANGTSAAADPGSFNPAGWDAEDTLWIAVAGSGETSTTGSFTGIASAPTNYSDYADSGISADVVGGVEGAVAFRQLNAASEDVGAFSVDVSNARNSALVIAVRPRLNTTVTPDTASLTTATFAPTVTATANQLVTPTTASLSLTGFTPTILTPVSVIPGVVSLTLTTFEPTVTVESTGITVTPSTASLTLTAFAPTINTPVSVTPSTATLNLSTFAPVVATPRTVTPTTASLTLTTFAPTVAAGVTVTPDAGALTLTGFAPDIVLTDNQLVTPGAASLALATFAATVLTPRSVTPSTAALVLTGFAPTVSAGLTIMPSPAALSLTGFAPILTIGGNVLVTPSTAALTLTTFAPTVSGGTPPISSIVRVGKFSGAISRMAGGGTITRV